MTILHLYYFQADKWSKIVPKVALIVVLSGLPVDKWQVIVTYLLV